MDRPTSSGGSGPSRRSAPARAGHRCPRGAPGRLTARRPAHDRLPDRFDPRSRPPGRGVGRVRMTVALRADPAGEDDVLDLLEHDPHRLADLDRRRVDLVDRAVGRRDAGCRRCGASGPRRARRRSRCRARARRTPGSSGGCGTTNDQTVPRPDIGSHRASSERQSRAHRPGREAPAAARRRTPARAARRAAHAVPERRATPRRRGRGAGTPRRPSRHLLTAAGAARWWARPRRW